jgi:DNA uptake protein ComE-like DNA-binding protein
MTKLIGALVMLSWLMAGCVRQDTEKTKQQAAQATEKFKEEAKEAAKQTKAALEGVKQGLKTQDKPVNINFASKNKLQSLPGVDEDTADRIIARRPYQTRNQLLAKGAVSPEEFKDIKDKIVVK